MLCCVFGPGYRGERGCCGTLWQDSTFSGVGVLSAVDIEVAVDSMGGGALGSRAFVFGRGLDSV